jgi:23S rRNA pseudouridine2605 synthase
MEKRGSMSPLQRVQKILSEAGVASRRKAEEMIREGRVTISGRPAQIGDKADPDWEHIKVDGKRIAVFPVEVNILLNKPKGTVTTVDDPEGRTTVMDLIQGVKTRLFPVGRLDYDAEGVLLMTNDGQMAHRLTHPSFQVPRVYQVKVRGKPSPAEIQRLSGGIFLEDGRTAPCKIRTLKETRENMWLEMVLFEGRNRQVKRMWEKCGFPVLKLKRIMFAGLTLGRLKPGEYRYLRPPEIKKVRDFLKGSSPGKNSERSIEDRQARKNPGNGL